MQRVLIGAAALIAALATGIAPPRGQSLPTLDEATALLHKAIAATDLTAQGMPPFHLLAKIRYTINDTAADGTFDLLLAAPDRKRIEVHLGSTGETAVYTPGKKYVLRTSPTMTYPVWSLYQFLQYPGPFYLGSESKATNVEGVGEGVGKHTCVTAESAANVTKEICFDAATNAVVSIHITATLPSDTPAGEGFELKLYDFVDLGPIRYPRHLLKQHVLETIDATVEKLEPAGTLAEDAFAPPPNAQKFDWCAEPVVARGSKPLKPKKVRLDYWSNLRTSMAFYVRVDMFGTPTKSVLVMHSGSWPTERLFTAGLGRGPYVRLACSGRAIEYETMALGGALDLRKSDAPEMLPSTPPPRLP